MWLARVFDDVTHESRLLILHEFFNKDLKEGIHKMLGTYNYVRTY